MCLKRHQVANSIICTLQGCDKKFAKVNGRFVHGKWFCNMECADKDPETKEIKDLYENGIDFTNPGENEEDDDVEPLGEDFEL